jgi:hypothetical protein
VRQQEVAEVTPTKITQGAMYNSDKENFEAANAVDKDLSTRATTTTDNGAGWMKIELGKSCFIHKIRIYYRFYTNWFKPIVKCAKSADFFRQCVDKSNNVDVSVYKGDVKQKSCGTLQLTYGLEQSDQIYALICNTEADTVKLSKTTGNIVVYEIAITGPGNLISFSARRKKV